MTEFLKNIWTAIFGTTEWLGLNIGFWMSMLAVVILVVVMIAVFWSMKPKNNVGEVAEAIAPETAEQKEQ